MNLFDLMAKITLDSSEYEKGLGDAEKKGGSFGSKLAGGLGKAAKVGAAAIGAASTAIAGFVGDSVKTGVSFDSSMSQIAATLGYTVDDIRDNTEKNGVKIGDTFKALREKALEMGAATNFSAEQAADGLNVLAMSGFDAEQSMSMIEDVLHLAAAGSMDLASAAGYVSGAMKGFADDTKDAGYYADLMAKGATLANTNVQQLGDAMSSGAAGAAAYGQSADSMTVALLRLAEQGEVGAAAGTALSAAMKNLYSPTNEAKKALKALGVTAYYTKEEAAAFNAEMEAAGDPTRVAAGQAKDFNEVVNSLDASLNALNEKGLAKYTDEQIAAYKQTIFGIQGLDAYNKMTVTGIETQNDWADALAHASDGSGEASKQYDTMTDNLQGDIDVLHSAFDGFKLAISDELTPTIRDFVQFGSDSFSRLTEAFREGGLDQAMSELSYIIREAIGKIVGMLPDLLKAGASLSGSLVRGILENLPSVMDAAIEIIMTLLDNITAPGNIENFINTAFTIIAQLVTSIAQALPELIPAAVSMIMQLVESLVDNIDILVDAAIALITGLAEGIVNAIPILIEKAPVIVSKLVSAIIRNAPKLFEAAGQIISKLGEGIAMLWEAVKSWGSDVINKIKSGIESMWSSVTGWGQEIIDKIWSGLSGAIEDAVSWGSDLISNFWSGIKSKLDWLWGNVKSVAQGIKNFLGFSEPEEGPLSDFHTYAPDMMELFMKGIEDNKRNLTDTVADAFDFGGLFTAPTMRTGAVPALAGASASGFDGTVNLYIDGDTLVGSTSEKMDRDLGDIKTIKARWGGRN